MLQLLLQPLMLASLASVLLSAGSCEQQPRITRPEPPPTQSPAQNGDARAALEQTIKLAQSPAAEEQKQLLTQLSTPSLLDRLDTPDERRRLPAARLRLAKVMQTLASNSSNPARQTLVALAKAPTFQSCDDCEELLVTALAGVRPPPPEVLRYWEQHATPESIHTGFTMDAVCENGAPEAIAILEKQLIAPKHELEDKINWLRDPVLRHRHDLPLLRGLQRVLSGGALPKELQTKLVEALFDYRPGEWYNVDVPTIKPPAPKSLSREAATVRKAIAQYALAKVTLPKGLRGIVAKAAQ